MAELRRRQGRLAEAAELFEQSATSPQGGLGLAAIALAQGVPTEAERLGRRVLRQASPGNHTARATALELRILAAAAAGRADTVQAARENDAVTKQATLELLAQNSAAAAAAIRAFGDAELDRAAPVSLNEDAPLTCQFMLEDHAVRHSYHHLARIRGAVQRLRAAA